MREPVLVDSSLHHAFTELYAIYVATGIVAAFSLPPSLEIVGGRGLTYLWIFGMAVIAATSLVWSLREQWQRREMICTSLLLMFLFVYVLAVLIAGFATGSLDRILVGVFSTSYLVFPAWRVTFFFRKLRKPRG